MKGPDISEDAPLTREISGVGIEVHQVFGSGKITRVSLRVPSVRSVPRWFIFDLLCKQQHRQGSAGATQAIHR